MILTNYTIEAMGYKEYPPEDVLEIRFGIIRAYSLRGLVFENDDKEKKSEVAVLADRCTAAIAQSINEACELLVGDKLADDEESWLKEKNAKPPFLLVYFKESVSRELKGGYRMEKDGVIYTYDAFPEGKKEIRDWEKAKLPSIVTALTVTFSTLNRQIELVPLERTIFGITNEGTTLFDLKVTGKFNGYISSPKSLTQINALFAESRRLLPSLTEDACRTFYSALNEKDRMKQFLGYFQFLERYTHSTYKTLHYGKDARRIFDLPQRIEEASSKFFEDFFSNSKSLAQRFHWCAIVAWNNIQESDINTFLNAKKIRDLLSHGEHVDESELPVENVKELALKLLGTRIT